ncbi:MAG: hypothetical protein M3P27_00895 [Acidobacteriota bacterium]|nr:hypothetical protein [Acidobacteriota bacterium]
MAAHDPEFAHEFVTNPEQFKVHFNLSEAQIKKIKESTVADIVAHGAPHVVGGGAAKGYY